MERGAMPARLNEFYRCLRLTACPSGRALEWIGCRERGAMPTRLNEFYRCPRLTACPSGRAFKWMV